MRRGTHFSCFAKKSKQKKATLHLRPATPDALATDNRGGCAQNSLASLPQTLIAKTPPRLSSLGLLLRDLTQLNEA